MAMLQVLVVDDDVAMCQLLARILRTGGHTVSCTADGEAALKLATGGAFDAVICDLRMPRVDGLELMRAVHAAAPNTAVILMTAHAGVKDAVEALHHGAFDFLLKPMSLRDLTDCLGRVAALKAQRRPEDQVPEPASASSTG
jgi:DNA-binding NtrC family response regulator